jgi:hypothetical protein
VIHVYHGRRTKAGCAVTVDGRPLDPRHDIYNHSPDGFEWGYAGSGPSQLALAMLAYEFKSIYGREGDDEIGRKALQYYQQFKRDVINGLNDNTWTITSEEIGKWLIRLWETT